MMQLKTMNLILLAYDLEPREYILTAKQVSWRHVHRTTLS